MTEFKRREFLKAALAAMAATGVAGCQTQPRPLVPEEQVFKRAELTARLQELARSSPPRNLARGAMCYAVAVPRYCPICGQQEYYGYKEEDDYKKAVEELRKNGLDVTLIVPELCQTCGSALERKKYILEIRYPDHPDAVRVELEDRSDLAKMKLFLQGKDRYDAGQSGEQPLKDKVERLRELFGIGEEE